MALKLTSHVQLPVLVLLLVMLSSIVTGAEDREEGGGGRIDALKAALDADREQAKNGRDGSRQGLLTPVLVPDSYLDEAGQASMRASLKAYYDYRIQGFQHRQRVFQWQLLSSKVIFVVVIFLVLAGIYFSWLQFRADLRKSGDGGEQSVSTLEASGKGIKVSSPVLGVIILVISLLFFYLYLQHVYPIEEIL